MTEEQQLEWAVRESLRQGEFAAAPGEGGAPREGGASDGAASGAVAAAPSVSSGGGGGGAAKAREGDPASEGGDSAKVQMLQGQVASLLEVVARLEAKVEVLSGADGPRGEAQPAQASQQPPVASAPAPPAPPPPPALPQGEDASASVAAPAPSATPVSEAPPSPEPPSSYAVHGDDDSGFESESQA